MTRTSDTSACPGEVPYEVQTPAGSAVITIVTAVMNVRPPGTQPGHQYDRVILRSASTGRPDVYAVFERRHGSGQDWWKVTDDLSLAQLDNWAAYRRRRVRPTQRFQRWLDHVRAGR
jgi:hypothetical protein